MGSVVVFKITDIVEGGKKQKVKGKKKKESDEENDGGYGNGNGEEDKSGEAEIVKCFDVRLTTCFIKTNFRRFGNKI